MMDPLTSCLMTGTVRHRRFTPIQHALTANLFMPCIDLDDLSQLNGKVRGLGTRWWHWARFRRADYVGAGPLKQAVLDKVRELGGDTLEQPRVMALIHLRYFGLYFSPVNFYYVYEREDWRYLLAEVSNTPWNQTHYYLIPVVGNKVENYQQPKAFHVSPFNPIEQIYCWRVKPLREKLTIHLECHQPDCVFDATLNMKRQSLTTASLLGHLFKTPIMAVKVIAGIYWHALILWIKGAPIYDHPNKKNKQ